MAAQTKAPDAAVVAQAQDALDAGDDLTTREAAALEAQRQVDAQRGYHVVDWKGIAMFRANVGGHTEQDERRMIAHVNEQRIAAADPFNRQG